MNGITAVVLAGGKGTRFWPFEQDKIVVPFLSKPLWQYTVKNILPKEITELVVVANSANISSFSTTSWGIPVKTVIQPVAKGMADALLLTKQHISNSRVLLLIADDLLEPTLAKNVLALANSTGAFAVLPGLHVDTYFPGGYLKLDGDRIIGIVEKPSPQEIPSSYINISGHFFSDISKVFDAIVSENDGRDDVYERALNKIMGESTFLMSPYQNYFASLKYPWHVLDMMDILLANVERFEGENTKIYSNVVIEGNVYIGNNVKIFENTKLVGPLYIGDHSIVGNSNVIRHSIIGANCVTGFNTDITRSYIGDSCWFHSNYIGDSILESNVSMGSGSVLANLRLDEREIGSVIKGEKKPTQRTKLGAIIGKDVRIGVNTSIMPGVKIGSRSFIGAGIVVTEDVPNDSFVHGNWQLSIEANKTSIDSDRSIYKQQL